jgi:hypothetical protein
LAQRLQLGQQRRWTLPGSDNRCPVGGQTEHPYLELVAVNGTEFSHLGPDGRAGDYQQGTRAGPERGQTPEQPVGVLSSQREGNSPGHYLTSRYLGCFKYIFGRRLARVQSSNSGEQLGFGHHHTEGLLDLGEREIAERHDAHRSGE